jgi:hypothetical protein
MNARSFFAELKRRNVYKVAADEQIALNQIKAQDLRLNHLVKLRISR